MSFHAFFDVETDAPQHDQFLDDRASDHLDVRPPAKGGWSCEMSHGKNTKLIDTGDDFRSIVIYEFTRVPF